MNGVELHQLTFRFREARIVFAGVELGVFEALADEARGSAELASKLALDEHSLHLLLEALAEMGVLIRKAEGYALEPECAPALLPGSSAFMGSLLLHDLWHWSSWAFLACSVRYGVAHRDRRGDPHLSDPSVLGRFLPNYTLAMEESGRASLARLADAIAPLEPRSVLDLGGGSGGLLLALLARWPHARGALADHEYSLGRARSLAAQHAAGARLELCDLDFERDELPRGHDLIVLSRVLMGLGPARASALVRRAAQALEPGGHLVVHDYDAATRVGAVLSVDMLLHCGGEVHGPAAVASWLADAGLELRASDKLLPYTRYWMGAKP